MEIKMSNFTIIVVDKKTLKQTSIALNDTPNANADGCSPSSLTSFNEWCNENGYDMLDMMSSFIHEYTTSNIPKNTFIHKLIIN